jgi:serine protease AprX
MGVVWKGPQRLIVLAVAGGLGFGVVGAAPASAAEPKPPPPPKPGAVVSTIWGDAAADQTALSLYNKNDAQQDPGSLFTITKAIGARDLWRARDAQALPITGRGVTVAVLDSGVSPVPGLDAPGKVVQGPDLSLEANSDTQLGPDTFGHGTHMAGIIAARDPVAVDPKTGILKADDGSKQLGVAPDAQLLALKLASTDGSTDVSQVIAALDWVSQHRTDNGMNVRVINLSFGTASPQPYQLDPLAAAAENAWHHGLVVVVSGGNGGPAAAGLTDPAIDPYLIAVGSSDPNNKIDGWTKAPRVADYSSRGTAERHVDLLAPGRSVVGLRDPGSNVDVNHPEGLVAGDGARRLFRGSGTSQAAAVVSGAVALMLQAYPDLTPDQVKSALVSTARPITNANPLDAGAGQLDLHAAMDAVKRAAAVKDPSTTLLAAQQSFPIAVGDGSLEQARGGANLVDPETGEVLSGEVDVQGEPWDGPTWSAQSAAGVSWSDGVWNRARWSGASWHSDGWARARWSGTSWSRARWSDVSWDRARWSRARWSDAAWERARWSGSAWS